MADKTESVDSIRSFAAIAVIRVESLFKRTSQQSENPLPTGKGIFKMLTEIKSAVCGGDNFHFFGMIILRKFQ